MFVVFTQASVTPKPGQGALDHPATGQYDKANPISQLLDDLDSDGELVHGPPYEVPFRSAVSTIAPELRYSREARFHPGQEVLTACHVADIGRMSGDAQQMTARINHDVSLAAGHLFFPHRSRALHRLPSFSRSSCR